MNSSGTPVSTKYYTFADLGQLQLTAQAAGGPGGMDKVQLSTTTGTDAYAASGLDNVLNLASVWTTAEFNVFGNENCSQATFCSSAGCDSGSTIVVTTSVTDGTTNAPSPQLTSYTCESNNLALVPPPCPIAGTSPAIQFTESNAAGATSTCPCPAGATWNPTTQTCDSPCNGATCNFPSG